MYDHALQGCGGEAGKLAESKATRMQQVPLDARLHGLMLQKESSKVSDYVGGGPIEQRVHLDLQESGDTACTVLFSR